MKATNLILLATFCIVLTNCNKFTNGSASIYNEKFKELENYKFDETTPDNLLKSIWTFNDKLKVVGCYDTRKNSSRYETYKLDTKITQLYTVLAKDVNEHRSAIKSTEDCLSGVSIYDRSIFKVEQPTPTRTTIYYKIKSISPIPKGASYEKYQEESRNEGESFKADFIKVENSWKIEQVYTFDDIINHDWSAKYTKAEFIPDYPSYVFQEVTP